MARKNDRGVRAIASQFGGQSYHEILNRLWRTGIPVEVLSEALARTGRGTNDPTDIIARLINRGMLPKAFSLAADAPLPPGAAEPFALDERGRPRIVHQNPPPRLPTNQNVPGALPGEPTPPGMRITARGATAPARVEFARQPTPQRGPAPGGSGDTGGGGAQGGGGGGTQVATAAGSTTPRISPGASDVDTEAFIRRHYGYLAWTLQVPEIRNVLFSAAREGWDDARLQGAVFATNWWKTTSASTRQWTQLQNEDPAEAARQVEGVISQIGSVTAKYGYTIRPERLNQIASDAKKFGWTPQEMDAAVAAEFDYDPAADPNSVPALVGQLKTQARQYLVPLSEQTIDQWGRDLIAGRTTEENFRGYLANTAKSLFPTLAAGLDQGQTTEQLVDPYRQVAARTLEVAPDQVDFMDPKWQRALHNVDPKAPTPTMMSLSDWTILLRTDDQYGYDRTTQAKEQGAQLSAQLLRTFGAVG